MFVVWASLAAIAVYAMVWAVSKKLNPPFVALELASDKKQASNVVTAWDEKNQTGRAVFTVILDMILVVFYVTAIVSLLSAAHASAAHAPAAIDYIKYSLMAAVVCAGAGNMTGDVCLLIMLVRGRAYSSLVGPTRLLGWFRYTVMALTLVYLVFREEVGFYYKLRRLIPLSDAWLGAVTLVVTFFVIRCLSVFSEHRPPLLSLLLAPDRLMANGVLERWGKSGRKSAERILLLESFLAMLYGVTLTTLCRDLKTDAPALHEAAEVTGWVAIVAASCHIAQNVGALVAVNRGKIGWWVGWMRRIGKVRITLASIVALYFVALLMRGEWNVLMAAQRWITNHAPKIPLPWS